MGEQNVSQILSKKELRNFTQHLFHDIRAIEIMLEKGMFEKGITRIGAEQEMCLIDSAFRPASIAPELLAEIENPAFTNELSKFNLEVNLDPQEFTGDCLSRMEKQLRGCLTELGESLKKYGADYIMVGILPTIRQSDLSLDNLMPNPRYFALNEAILQMRGGPYEFRIQGSDELISTHDSLMFESCNTSFQVHYQVEARDFVKKYNWAQAITAPVLSVATNSPLLFGHRLWRETRIALFQQSADTRNVTQTKREVQPRVFFGDRWLDKSVMEIFREEVARYRVLISTPITENSLDTLKDGGIPKLKALRLHNGTIYTWNRPCYGITNGLPHLRIENRVLPSGPTVIDEMANTAFWLGLMHGMPKQYDRINKKIDFDVVKSNFMRAARTGMGAMFRWVDGKPYSAQDLICKELIPMAKEGLKIANIRERDINRYMDVIEERAETGKSGSQWMLDSFNALKKKGTKEEAIVATTAGIVRRQKNNKPVAKWGKARINEAGSWMNRYWRVDQIMSRSLYTVQDEDLIDLVQNIMSWKDITHLPVENAKGEFVGIVTARELLNYYANRMPGDEPVAVKDVMIPKSRVIVIDEDVLTTDAITLLRKNNISCLPVLNAKHELIGIVTERDFVNVADHFLHEFLNGQVKIK
ncbi:MAG: glutamate-cysteine ligase family protein [Bacteroidota bacterium]